MLTIPSIASTVVPSISIVSSSQAANVTKSIILTDKDNSSSNNSNNNNNDDITLIIVLLLIGVFLLVSIPVGYFKYKEYQNKNNNNNNDDTTSKNSNDKYNHQILAASPTASPVASPVGTPRAGTPVDGDNQTSNFFPDTQDTRSIEIGQIETKL